MEGVCEVKEVRINTQDSVDRERTVVALANAGYSVRVEIEKIGVLTWNYYVVFTIKDNDIKDTK